jgi:hypothetical protein
MVGCCWRLQRFSRQRRACGSNSIRSKGVRPFEGEVRWNDAERHGNNPPIAHGILFAGPVGPGLAVDLFVRPPPGK